MSALLITLLGVTSLGMIVRLYQLYHWRAVRMQYLQDEPNWYVG